MKTPAPHSDGPLEDVRHAVVQAVEEPARYGLRQWVGWFLGPGLLLATLLLPPPDGLSLEGWRTAGAGALMATWWISETIPIPATSLLPLVLFPFLHVSNIRETAAPYANPLVFLFLGGFLIALAMQRWNLHRRIAIGLIGCMGAKPSRIVLGFLLAAALVSMWVSNTATALMMYPIALSVIHLVPRDAQGPLKNFGVILMLAVAYGATTGGMATLIGTPPNALLAGYVNETYGIQLGFGEWMLLGVPVSLVGLVIIYFALTRVLFQLPRGELPGMAELIREGKSRLGPISRAEIYIVIVFGLTAAGWIFQPLLARTLPMLSDTVIGMAGGLLLFLIPVNIRRGEFVMNWKATQGLPWDVLILFGGGLTLAANIERHGLAAYLGTLFTGLDGLPFLVTMAIVCFGILLLTELTSNTATAATFLPIVASIAIALGENPLLLLIPTALAANCSFMMPVGTPPNAIVFGSGLVSLPQMARTGMWLNIVFVPLIVGFVLLIGRFVFGITPGVLPPWAQ